MKIDELYIGRQLTKQDHRGMDKTKSPDNGKEIKSISPTTQEPVADKQPMDPNQITAVRKEITGIADPAFKGTSLARLLNNMDLNTETTNEPQGSVSSVAPGTTVTGKADADGNFVLSTPGDDSGEEIFVPAAIVKAQNPLENLQILAGIKK